MSEVWCAVNTGFRDFPFSLVKLMSKQLTEHWIYRSLVFVSSIPTQPLGYNNSNKLQKSFCSMILNMSGKTPRLDVEASSCLQVVELD